MWFLKTKQSNDDIELFLFLLFFVFFCTSRVVPSTSRCVYKISEDAVLPVSRWFGVYSTYKSSIEACYCLYIVRQNNVDTHQERKNWIKICFKKKILNITTLIQVTFDLYNPSIVLKVVAIGCKTCM